MSKPKLSTSERAAIGGRARAKKLTAEQRYNIAMKGAQAAMKKAGYEPINDKLLNYNSRRQIRKDLEESENFDTAAANLILDPVAWIEHYLRNPETREPFVLYEEQKQFLREAFTPDPVTLKLRYDEIVFSAPKKRGKCKQINELLPLADGSIVPVGELIGKHFEVLTLDSAGKVVRARAHATFNAYEPVYKLTTDSGWSVVQNAEHPFFVGTRRKPWKESIVSRGFEPLSQLKCGDLIAVAEEMPAFGDYNMRDEEVLLLAYMIADGCCTRGTPVYVKPLSKQSQEFVACAKALDCEVTQYNEIHWRARSSYRERPNALTALLKQHNILGKRSEQKEIPKAVFSLSKRQLALFLSRLFGGDGWASINDSPTGVCPQIGYSTASKELALGIRYLLSRFGVHVRYRIKKAYCNGVECQDAHVLSTVRSEDVLKFGEEIGLYGKEDALDIVLEAARARKPYDWIYYKAPPGCRWEKIKSIEPMGTSATVAIEVPGYHTFLTPLYEHNTTTAAMALLYVIIALGDERAEGYIASNSREQSADRVFSDCSANIKASPLLAPYANPRNDAIEFPATQAFIKTVTTEAASAAGGRPTIVVFDELWGFQNKAAQRLWDELVTTPTTRISVRFTVTYAGFTGESNLLEGMYRRIFDVNDEPLPEVETIAKDLYRRGRMLVYWSHDVRPPWVTDEWIETQRLSYSPNQFARIMENRWVSSESTFIEADAYDRCVTKSLQRISKSPRLHVWSAVDASIRKDCTAIVTVALDATEISQKKTWLDEVRSSPTFSPNPLLDMIAALPWKEDFDDSVKPVTLSDLRIKVVDHKIFEAQAGRQIDFARVENYILDLRQRFTLDLVGYDPYQMISVAQGLTRLGVPMYEIAQTPRNTMEFSGLLRDLISQQRLRTYEAGDLRSHVLNAIAKESDRGWHIVKRTQAAKIDAAVALAMAAYGCARSFSFEPEDRRPEAPVGDIYAI